MRGFAPCVVVMLVGVALMIVGAAAWATTPQSGGGRAPWHPNRVQRHETPRLQKQTGCPVTFKCVPVIVGRISD